MEKLWLVKETDENLVAKLKSELGCSAFLAGLLVRRGIVDWLSARRFLAPLEQIEYCDPRQLPDMAAAVARINAAVKNKEPITVYGDYDVDGMTATAVLVRFLRRQGAAVDYYVPDRLTEGYGINSGALEYIVQRGTRLLISVDCGITSLVEVAAFNRQMDIIITDHHLPGNELPAALAVIDPHRRDALYPFAELAGVGVAFKLCQAIVQSNGGDWQNYETDIDLVALGTVADVVSLTDENRRIVAAGIQAINDTKNIGLRALIDASGNAGRDINSHGISFMLAPRLNAAGRMDSARVGVELLLADDAERAADTAEYLNELNSRRQEEEKRISLEAEKQLVARDIGRESVIVVVGEDWHPGVIGIVASRLVDKYYRPVVVITMNGDMGKGSCRSVPGFNLHQALASVRDLLDHFGGHEMAAGLGVTRDNIEKLRAALNRYAAENLTAELRSPRVEVECILTADQLTPELVADVKKLEPTGADNRPPVFAGFNIRPTDIRVIGYNQEHLTFRMPGRDSIRSIFWRHGDDAAELAQTAIDCLFQPQLNEYRGNISVECVLSDWRPSLEICRDTLAALYKKLPADEPIADGATDAERYQVKPEFLSLALKIFAELGFLTTESDGSYRKVPEPTRAPLVHSALYRQNGGA